MDAPELRRILTELFGTTPAPSSSAPPPTTSSPLALARELATVVIDDVLGSAATAGDLHLAASHLFHPSSGILSWLSRALHYTHREYAKSRAEVVTILARVVEAAAGDLLMHIRDIKDMALSLLRRDVSNEVKVAVFGLLTAILDARVPELNSDVLGIESLADCLITDLARFASRGSQTLMAKYLEFLGIMIERFPVVLSPHVDDMLETYLDHIRANFAASKPKFFVLAASVDGLASLHAAFPDKLDSRAKAKAQLFKHVASYGVVIPPSLKRFAVPRACLAFLARHAASFASLVLGDAIPLYARLVKLTTHTNTDIKKYAFATLDALVDIVVDDLAHGPSASALGLDGLHYFMQVFLGLVDSSRSASAAELAFAIRSCGKMTRPMLAAHGAPDQVDKVLAKIFELSAKVIDPSRSTESIVVLIPSFLWAYASALDVLPTVHAVMLAELERVIGVGLLAFPRLWPRQRETLVLAFSSLFLALYYKGAALSALLDRVVYQGLWITCSSRAALDALTAPSTGLGRHSASASSMRRGAPDQGELYIDYLALWTSLLDPELTSPYAAAVLRSRNPEIVSATRPLFSAPAPDVAALQTELYDAILSSMVRMLRTLVVSYSLSSGGSDGDDDGDDDEGSPTSLSLVDLARGLRPTNLKDYEIFLLLVDFALLFIPSVATEASLRWMAVLGSAVIDASIAHPTVSGYYKILGALLGNAEKHRYFCGLTVEADIQATAEPDSRLHIYTAVYTFATELVIRLKQFTGDLLAAALECILALPRELVVVDLVLPVLATAFRIGVGYTPLASVAMSALEHWTAVLPAQFSAALPTVLPLLNGFLHVKADEVSAALTDMQTDEASRLTRVTSASRRGPARESDIIVSGAESDTSVSVRDLQLRILTFLGTIAGKAHDMVPPPARALAAAARDDDGSAPALGLAANTSTSAIMRWDVSDRIKFELPFRDVLVSVYLDDLLPRLAVLAEHSSQRQAKIAAAEALHSIVLYMIGSARASSAHSPSPYAQLYRHVFPVLLRLAADVDTFTCRLFHPFVIQLIHWFTSSAPDAEDTLALLDAVVDAVSAPSAALRELSAHFLAEFFAWAIKQSSAAHAVANKLQVSALLSQVFALALHPAPFRRLGAANTYLAIYRTFREEPNLVSKYVLAMLSNVLTTLRLSASDPPGLGTEAKAKRVLKALVRIIRKYESALRAPDPNRLASGYPDLDAALDAIFEACASLHMPARHAAVETFAYFASRGLAASDVVTALSAPLESHLAAEPSKAARLSSRIPLDLAAYHSVAARLTAALDGCIWAMSDRLVPPTTLPWVASAEPSPLLDVLHDFLHHLASPPLANATSAEARQQVISATTLLLVKVFIFVDLAVVTAASQSGGVAPQALLGKIGLGNEPTSSSSSPPPFVTLLVRAALAPSSLSFAMGDREVRSCLPDVTASVLSSLARVAHDALVGPVAALLAATPELQLSQAASPSANPSPDAVEELVAGYGQFARAGLVQSVLGMSRDAFANELLDETATAAARAAASGTHTASPRERALNMAKLSLALQLGVSPQAVLAKLTADEPVAVFSAAAEVDADIAAMEVASASVSLGTAAAIALTPSSIASTAQPSGSNAPATSSAAKARITTAGALFFAAYSEPLAQHMIQTPSAYIPQLAEAAVRAPHAFDALLAIVKTLLKAKPSDAPAVHGAAFTSQLLGSLDTLAHWWSPAETTPLYQRDAMLTLFAHLFMLPASAFDMRTGKRHAGLAGVVVTAMSSLLDLSLPLAFRIRVLALLPQLLSHLADADESVRLPLVVKLNDLVINDFPASSRELDRFSPAYTQYIAALDALLGTLRTSGSLEILEILLPVFQESNHAHGFAVASTAAAMVKTLPLPRIRAVFEFCFGLFSDASHPESLRMAIVRLFCVPILEGAPTLLVSAAALQIVGPLLSIIGKPVAARAEAMGAPLSLLFCEATCAFNMVQVIFERLELGVIKLSLNEAYLRAASGAAAVASAKGTELIKAVLKSAHAAKSETFDGLDADGKALRLTYHRAAFNAMVTVVMRTQDKEPVYHTFLFKENPEKGVYIWENVVDLETRHAFEAQTSFRTVKARGTFATFTQRFSSRKKDVRASTAAYFRDSSLLSQDPTGLFFLNPSQRLVSSLEDDDDGSGGGESGGGGGGENQVGAGVATASTTTAAGAAAAEAASTEAGSETSAEARSVNKVDDDDSDVYELDAINSNPCMPIMLQLLDHLRQLFPTAYTTAPGKEAPASMAKAAMPKWMRALYDKLSTGSTPGNVRLFIVKMMINRPGIFEPFAGAFVRPLLEFALSDSNGGPGLHYFVRDVLSLLLEAWQVVPSEDGELASRTLSFVMRNTMHESSLVLRSNLALVAQMVAGWKGVLRVSKSDVLDHLEDGAIASRMGSDEALNKCLTVGLQLLGLIMGAGLPAYSASEDQHLCSSEQFYSKVVSLMTHKSKRIMRLAAEAAGLIMKQEQERPGAGAVGSSAVARLVHDTLMTMFRQAEAPERAVVVFHEVLKNCGAALDAKLFNQLFHVLLKLPSAFVVMGLSCVLKRAHALPQLFSTFRSFLETFVRHRDRAVQLHALKITFEAIKKVSDPDELESSLATITSVCAAHPSSSVREVGYDICIWLFDNWPLHYREPRSAVVLHLLAGIDDPSETLATKLVAFWDHGSRLPAETFARLEQILTLGYAPQLEGVFLKFSVQLLLRLTTLAPGFKKAKFEPLDARAQFVPMEMDTSWATSSLPMAPLFRGGAHAGAGGGGEGGDDGFGMLQATLAGGALFSLTQATGMGESLGMGPGAGKEHDATAAYASFEPMGEDGAGGDAQAHQQFSLAFDPSDLSINQSNLYFGPEAMAIAGSSESGGRSSGTGKSRKRKRAAETMDIEASMINELEMEPTEVQTSSQPRLFRKRFRKSSNRDAGKVISIARAHKRARSRATFEAQKVAIANSSVRAYRKYRVGELPDVAISPADIIKPLQAAAMQDDVVARLVLVDVVGALFEHLVSGDDTGLEEEDADAMAERMEQAVGRMFAETRAHGGFVAALLDLARVLSEVEAVDFSVNARELGTAAHASLNYHAGILLLEAQAQAETASGSEVYVQLARLYKAVGERDVLRGLYEVHVAECEETHRALAAQLDGHYQDAMELYHEALEKREADASAAEAAMWESERLECYKALGMWKSLADAVAADDATEVWLNTVEGDEDEVRLVLTSYVKLNNRLDALVSFVNSTPPTYKDRLVTEYAAEMALVSIVCDENDAARAYVNRAMELFLERWASLHPLATAGARRLVRMLPALVEYDEFLQLAGRGVGLLEVDALETLVTEWASRLPSRSHDGPGDWDETRTRRTLLLNKLIGLFDTPEACEAATHVVAQHELGMLLAAAEGTAAIGACELASKYVHEAKIAIGKVPALGFEFFRVVMGVGVAGVARLPVSAKTERFKLLVKLGERVEDQKPLVQGRHEKRVLAMVDALWGARFVEELISAQNNAELPEGLARILQVPAETLSRHKCIADFARRSVDAFSRALGMNVTKAMSESDEDEDDGLGPMVVDETGSKVPRVAAAFLARSGMATTGPTGRVAFAMLCNSIAREMEEELDDRADAGGMACGEEGGTDLFPRVLGMLHSAEARAAFRAGWEAVPEWVVLRWVPQLVAMLSDEGSVGEVVSEVVQRVAEAYPQAVYFPYTVSEAGMSAAAIARNGGIKAALATPARPLLERMVAEFDRLTHPHLRWKDFLTELKQLLRHNAMDEAVALWRDEMVPSLFQKSGADEMTRAFASYSEVRKLVSEFGSDGSGLKALGRKRANNAVNTMNEMLLNRLAHQKKNRVPLQTKLEAYSPWLASFASAYDTAERVLVPGQFEGLRSKPVEEEMTAVSSFGAHLLVLQSIRLPKRISIHGSDEADSLWLVKGGEDLRLDQRVQQLFGEMNRVLAEDPLAAARSLHVARYAVVPCTVRVGLIEWMRKTKPLKDLISEEIAARERAVTSSARRRVGSDKGALRTATAAFAKFIHARERNGDTTGQMYERMFMRGSVKDAVSNYHAAVKCVPWDALRAAVLKLAAGPEALLAVRGQFVTSLAVFNMCSYVVGIGDRHLANLLLDLSTGGLVGIDYGHAFGSATQYLPVPELMPFRLTPQLVNCIKPWDVDGVLNHTMRYALGALRGAKERLLTVMDVFVREPITEWVRLSSRLSKETVDKLKNDFGEEWRGAVRLEAVKKKLSGVVTSDVMVFELDASLHHGKAHYGALVDVVRANCEKQYVRKRTGMTGNCADVAEQVTMLIDHATDENVLGRVWKGWEPFL
ncbi:DNA-dependent protein kinase catalytic subunit [Thecamonas trahens ATCC 50062]|uniref:non-specific serine/threonine protein kinase n=1 Tax=Thecamonas trahens ATCC 50062 TaxID=461836 RepID=A0A0L0DUR1_THETB|nr:DNA-dependent protein kinase catalytic subunit [Thecamonas trahens ATCC 50062]KNC55970.1 DNA-dependent protein kinase catalytic subunit [Thecamonas trahens ATCC 50062]|eukprot:XP_013761017.1 DNA-dependent protein kinase catalytic subunit [Thecamonas trahens ATCC 50062]